MAGAVLAAVAKFGNVAQLPLDLLFLMFGACPRLPGVRAGLRQRSGGRGRVLRCGRRRQGWRLRHCGGFPWSPPRCTHPQAWPAPGRRCARSRGPGAQEQVQRLLQLAVHFQPGDAICVHLPTRESTVDAARYHCAFASPMFPALNAGPSFQWSARRVSR